jgi:hypothetical protein
MEKKDLKTVAEAVEIWVISSTCSWEEEEVVVQLRRSR